MSNGDPNTTKTTPADESHRLYSEARVALGNGDRSEAIGLLRRAASLAPHFKTYELLGEALLDVGECNDAVLYLSAAAGLGTKSFRALFLLARALLKLDPPRAIDAAQRLQDALHFNPNYKAARELLEELSQQNSDVRQWITQQ